MTTYFEARTNDGILQIQDSQPLLYFLNKTNLSSYYIETKTLKYAINSGTYANHDVHIYSIPISDNPMYIGTPSSGIAHVFPTHLRYAYRYNNYRIAESLGKHNVLGIANIDKSIADNMILYTFKQGDVPSTNIGLECYNENGERVFSSGCRVLKLLYANLFTHCRYGDERNGNYTDLSATHNYSGKTIAFNCTKSAYYKYQASSSDISYGRSPICLLSSGKVQMATITRLDEYTSSMDYGYNGTNYHHLLRYQCYDGGNQTAYSIIDVTNC